jgi:urease accessory protein
MLVKQNKPNWILQMVLGAIAGLFHGYAYGEAIIGAGMTRYLPTYWVLL